MFRSQLKRLLAARDDGASIGKRRCCHVDSSATSNVHRCYCRRQWCCHRWIAMLEAISANAISNVQRRYHHRCYHRWTAMLQVMSGDATSDVHRCYRQRRWWCHRWTAVLQVMSADAIRCPPVLPPVATVLP
jgi:hypothetical protein